MTNRVALITGASFGIGEQLAARFARAQFDLILVARTVDKLEHVAAHARSLGATAHVLPFDLSDPGAPAAIFAAVEGLGLSVDCLINNAGFGERGDFLDLDLENAARMVSVNCNALLRLTHLFAQPMRVRQSGQIVNIASLASFLPGPSMATLFATKAFVLSFSEALAYELRDSGVTVTAYCPGATQTQFATRAGNGDSVLFTHAPVATPAEVADDLFESMRRGDVVAVHGALNWLATQSVRLSPRALLRALAAVLNRPV